MASYVSVTWTTGDVITEAKMDNMVANDRAEDAHETGVELLNTKLLEGKDAGGTLRTLIGTNAGDDVLIGDTSLDDVIIRAGAANVIKEQITTQEIAVGTFVANTVTQRGWGFVDGLGTSSSSASISFPLAFSEVPTVVASSIGFKDGSDPTTPDDFGQREITVATSRVLSASQWRVGIVTTTGSNIPVTRRIGYAWIAMGVIN